MFKLKYNVHSKNATTLTMAKWYADQAIKRKVVSSFSNSNIQDQPVSFIETLTIIIFSVCDTEEETETFKSIYENEAKILFRYLAYGKQVNHEYYNQKCDEVVKLIYDVFDRKEPFINVLPLLSQNKKRPQITHDTPKAELDKHRRLSININKYMYKNSPKVDLPNCISITYDFKGLLYDADYKC